MNLNGVCVLTHVRHLLTGLAYMLLTHTHHLPAAKEAAAQYDMLIMSDPATKKKLKLKLKKIFNQKNKNKQKVSSHHAFHHMTYCN